MKAAALVTLAFLSEILPAPPLHAACWRVVPGKSRITFSVNQAGAPMEGRFRSADGRICIAADNVNAEHVRVTVDPGSVETGLPELDEALRGPDFFDVPRWPKAIFEGGKIAARGGDRFEASGQLTIRNVSKSLSIPFTLMPAAGGGNATLHTVFTIKRLDYGIGQGQWADTQWVGNEIHIEISATLKRTPPSAEKPKS